MTKGPEPLLFQKIDRLNIKVKLNHKAMLNLGILVKFLILSNSIKLETSRCNLNPVATNAHPLQKRYQEDKFKS